MLIKKPDDIRSSEITSESVYLNRRNFIRGTILAGSALATGVAYRTLNAPAPGKTESAANASDIPKGYVTAEGEVATKFEDITNYNNFYEFSTSKQSVAVRSKGFVTRPWTVEVGGLVHKPMTFDIDQLTQLVSLEDRIYRMRCVEGWSMVIPWRGFPLARLLSEVEPMGTAKYVRFVTLYDGNRMPNQLTSVLPWPYVEGLRLDEAMHPLTILATGLYEKPLLPQNGAPLRLVVPWKYGFKGIKSIVQIVLTAEEPKTTWAEYAPDEYGFYANVNPEVSHPRWSQAHERRIGEFGMRPTLMFNGYRDHVAHLYQGMDLQARF